MSSVWKGILISYSYLSRKYWFDFENNLVEIQRKVFFYGFKVSGGWKAGRKA